MRRLSLCILITTGSLIAMAAIAQTPISAPVDPDAIAEPVDQAVAWAAAAAGLFVIVMNAIATVVPSAGRLMKIVDTFAFNWGKARNDPALQKWGK